MITKKRYAVLPDGRPVDVYGLENGRLRAEILTYGATLDKLFAPDRDGNAENILVTFDNLQDRMEQSAYQGEVVGRYANRIAGAAFTLHGTKYNLTVNENGVTNLHGGAEFSRALWEAEPVGDNALELCYTSPSGAEGFPGTVQTKVRYTLEEDAVAIDYWAVSDQDTVFSLTNHAYFNLAAQGDILGHWLQVHAETFLPTDALSIPTGAVQSVAGTVFDFRQPKPIGQEIAADEVQLKQCKGYDHNFCLRAADAPAALVTAAVARDPGTGRILTVETDQPGILLYTGNYLEAPFLPRQGFCLETQAWPNSPNQPGFTNCILKAGEEYRSVTKFRCSVE